MNELLKVSSLFARYGRRIALREISFTLSGGEICAVLGENGSGKTTLLRAIGMRIPSAGSVLLDGRDLREMSDRERAREIGCLFSNSGTKLPLNCLEAVLMGDYPLTGALRPVTEERRENAVAMLSLLGVEEFANRDFLTLSSGERQQVLLARTLLRPTRLMLLDEPEDALDFRRRQWMLSILRDRTRETGCGVLLSMHDVNAALRCADRILTLKNGMLTANLFLAETGEAELRRALREIYGEIGLFRRNGAWLMTEGG